MRVVGWVVLLVVVIGIAFFAYTRTHVAATPISEEVARLRNETTPADSQLKTVAELARSDYGVRSSWEIEMSLNWEEYRRLIEKRLVDRYQPAKSDDGRLLFTRQLPGDSQNVEVTQVANSPRTRVRVTFQSHAD